MTWMCIDYPGRVVSLEGDVAVVDAEGRRRRATTLLIGDVAVGEWVTVSAGTIVDRLTAEEASAIQVLLRTAEAASPRPSTEPGNQTSKGRSRCPR